MSTTTLATRSGPTGLPGLREQVMAALDTVRDPELDAPVTDLGFVAECTVGDKGSVRIALRLPTYFCAPNFAYLMVADADDAVRAVPGTTEVTVELVDHFTADQINHGVAARRGFVAAFGDEAAAELDELRSAFLRKAVLAGTDLVCAPLVRAGRDVMAMTLGEAPTSPDLIRLRARRAELGLPAGDEDPLVIDPDTGVPPERDDLRLHLGRARLSRVNIEANSGICRGMLAHRYPQEDR